MPAPLGLKVALTVILKGLQDQLRNASSGTIYTLGRRRGRIYHALTSAPAGPYPKLL
jgi:hypothetical protein